MPVHAGGGTKFASRQKEKLKEPEELRVVLLNDDYTTMDFVVEVLMRIFHKNGDDALRIMINVHQQGRGIVGQYPQDIARTKAEQVHAMAKAEQFPLKCVLEPA
ncbi:ATP-dependent Clp protease adapter protein ClpS [Spirochaetia bacterium]|nr:ATP-dependent Clp protease adapter protein ClpS [Spirochaetia bacterium]GHV81812.1 ATP-dependent Clp protease adapter protein ClpS [Spirochaetia bacterium]